jgi:hypothetical protein
MSYEIGQVVPDQSFAFMIMREIVEIGAAKVPKYVCNDMRLIRPEFQFLVVEL